MKSLTLLAMALMFSGSLDGKFDLECEASNGSTERYRIDLPSNLWCKGGCNEVFTIKKVTDEELDLNDFVIIDRNNLKLSGFAATWLGLVPVDGQCKKRRYSGMA